MAFLKLASIADTKGRCRQKGKALFLTECCKAPSQASLVQ